MWLVETPTALGFLGEADGPTTQKPLDSDQYGALLNQTLSASTRAYSKWTAMKMPAIKNTEFS